MKKDKNDNQKNMKGVTGKVVSTKMQKTVIVEVTRFVRHPIYKKAMRKTRKFAADPGGLTVAVGDMVKIISTRPISKRKHYRIVEKIVL